MLEITNTYLNKTNIQNPKHQVEGSSKYSVQISLIPPGFNREDKKSSNENRENQISDNKILNPFAQEFKPLEKKQEKSEIDQQIIQSGGLIVKKVKLPEAQEPLMESNQNQNQQDQETQKNEIKKE